MVFQQNFQKRCKWCAMGQCTGCKSNDGKGKGGGSFNPAFGGKGGGGGPTCHTCGKFGHKSPDCFQNQNKGGGGWGGGGKGFGQQKGGGKGKNRRGSIQSKNASKTIWVGNIADGVTFQDLKAHCDQAGASKWAEVFKNKGKGTGAVGFATEAEAATALGMLNGSLLNGQALECDSWEKQAKQ